MSINQITPEAIYRQLGSLVAELPDLLEVPVKPATHVWLGRVGALVEAMGDGGKIAAFQVAVRSLHGILQEESAARGYLRRLERRSFWLHCQPRGHSSLRGIHLTLSLQWARR
jgi:hypothetical protein